MIHNKGWPEICVSNVVVARLNHQILIVLHPLSSIFNFEFSTLFSPCSYLKSLLKKLQFSNFHSSSSILSQKYRISDSKFPQNSRTSDKLSASVACTTCIVCQVWLPPRNISHHPQRIVTIHTGRSPTSLPPRKFYSALIYFPKNHLGIVFCMNRAFVWTICEHFILES